MAKYKLLANHVGLGKKDEVVELSDADAKRLDPKTIEKAGGKEKKAEQTQTAAIGQPEKNKAMASPKKK